MKRILVTVDESLDRFLSEEAKSKYLTKTATIRLILIEYMKKRSK